MRKGFTLYLVLLLMLSSFSKVEVLRDHLHIDKTTPVGYLSLPRERSIDQTLYLYVKYALEEFRKEKVAFVLLDLDTPGGEVFSALQIAQELKKMDTDYGIPVLAFVDQWALSAGALLAYSCRYIAAGKESSMGAAEPVLMSEDKGMVPASEKIVSALRVEFAKAAEGFGRDPWVAKAMVDRDVVLVLRQGVITPLLDNNEIDPSDKVINSKGKLLTLSGDEMKELGLVDLFVPGSFSPLSGQETIAKTSLFSSYSLQWVSYTNWKLGFFSFLSHPFVSSMLLFGLVMGFYLTFQSQTIGASFLIGLVCLSLIVLTSFEVALIGYLELLFVVLGLSLFLLDLLLFGFGFLAVAGFFLAVGGLIALLLPSLEGIEIARSFSFFNWIDRLTLFLVVVLCSLVAAALFSRLFFSRRTIRQRLVLKDTNPSLQELPPLPAPGTKAEAYGALCPFGNVKIGEEIFEAKSEGTWIHQGASLEVIGAQGRYLIVREIE